MTTNLVTAKYTEIIDLQTKNDTVSVIGIHTPIGAKPRLMLNGFFSQFRKFKYRGCSLRMVPAAQLPVDPLGLSGIPGTTDVMDPRDALNPIMFHGCHGDNLNFILNQIYKEGRYSPFSDSSDSLDIQDNDFNQPLQLYRDEFYYAALSDPSWKKFGIQSGVRLKGLRPLVHKVALTKQMVPSSQSHTSGSGYSFVNDGQDYGKLALPAGLSGEPSAGDSNDGPFDSIGIAYNGTYGGDSTNDWNVNQMFTNGVQSLGWLPTSNWYLRTSENSQANGSLDNAFTGPYYQPEIGGGIQRSQGATTYLPKIFMGILLMPPSYKQEQFLRCSITHYFAFKDFTTSLDPAQQVLNYSYHDFIDHGANGSITVKDAIKDTYDLGTLEVVGGVAETVTSGVN